MKFSREKSYISNNEKKKKNPLYLSILNLEEVPKFFPIAHLTTLLVSKEVVINNQYIYIYIYKERSHLRAYEILSSGAHLEDSLAIKDMDFLFSLVHRFKTIHLSLTKIITLCLLNKHQLKDNDSLFS